ncbi:hypothetical protein ACFVU3_31705 [Streptomyces sp. NPDC058052]|uniref:hypothetical protein n=1 Tax=Streptomyces sp. NPDC058052 TaxID=3346316 RepID=UPI0036E8A25C
MTMLTTPARTAMEGHGLTNPTIIVDAQRTAIAYAVLSPATGRYSLMTLDGRWVIPSAEGYKTRGPATTYARKHAAELRPEGLRVYEPIRHTARPQVGRYGARRKGLCMGQVQSGGVGYECGSCRALLTIDSMWREGFTIVRDGRGTHTLSYALDKSHARSFGEGAQKRVTSPEGEKAIAALQVELETIRHETESIKSLAGDAETHAAAADVAKDAALESRNVAQAYTALMAAVAAAREIALLVKLAVRRCEALDKLRDAFRALAESIGVEGYAADADRLYEEAKGDVDSAWEYCGAVEDAERTATAAAMAAQEEYGHRCLKCGTFFRQPTCSGEAPLVPCACSALYAGSVADVTDPGTIPAPWECDGQLEFPEGAHQQDVDAVGDAPQDTPADAPQEVPTWIANISLPALTVTDRAWWIGSYGQWTTRTLSTRGTPRAVLKFARAAESVGWTVALRAGIDNIDDETTIGVWEVEATGRCHDNVFGGQRDAVLSVMWIQKREGGRWTFDRERSAAEIGDRVLSGIETLADYEKSMRVGRPAKAETATDAAPVPAPIAAQTVAAVPAAETAEPIKIVAAETAPAPAPAAPGPRVVPLVESVRRARDEQHAASARAWDAQTSVKDLDDACKEAVSLGLSVDQEQRLRGMQTGAAAAASDAESTAFRARAAADALERSRVDSAVDMVQMRERTARLFAGEGDDRPRWVSSDGRTVMVSAPSPEWSGDGTAERFAALLAGAVAAKDASRMLKSTDVPTKPKHGRGGTTEFRQAVARSVRPLVQPWKAPRVPAEGKPLDGVSLAALDADGVCAETEAAPGVWVPQAAVHVADTAVANGWTVSMERDTRGNVTVRVAGTIVRESGYIEGKIVAIWTSGMYDAARSHAQVGARRLDAQLERVLTTINHPAEPGTITTAPAPAQTSAPAPHGVSDPSGADTWETDGGCHPAARPTMPSAHRPTATDSPSKEIGTCTGQVDVTVPADTVSDLGTAGTWDGEGGAVPSIEPPTVHPALDRSGTDSYDVRPSAIEWTPAPGTDRRTGTLDCAGVQYRIYHAPTAALPYTLRRMYNHADIDLGGWADVDDVCAIVRADCRRTAALEAHRLHIERQQRHAAHRMQGERRQATVCPTAEERRTVARRAAQDHRPAAAELYVSPITGTASVALVCGTCRSAHDDREGRPQSLGAGYTTPQSADPDALAALLTKRGWNVSGPWTPHGTRGDTLRAPITPTPAYLEWQAASHGPAPQAPAAAPGERITPVARGWWEVVSAEGHRYELTWRPALTGAVWRVRYQSAPTGSGAAVARTERASAAMAELRSHSASLAQESALHAH